TLSRGASKTRVIVMPYSPASLAIAGSRSQALFQAVEALVPEPAVPLEPFGGVLQRRRAEARGSKLRRAAALDQAGALEHPEVLRDRLDADRKRLRQLVHRRLPG